MSISLLPDTFNGFEKIVVTYFRVKQFVPLWLKEVDDAFDGSRKRCASNEQSEEDQVGEKGRKICNLREFKGLC